MARNTNRQGANFELAIMHYLEEHGYTCLRSSGSKGKVDVVAVGPEQTEFDKRYKLVDSLLFVQAKITATPLRSPLSPAERQELMDLALRAGALPLTASKAKDETTGKVRPHFRLLTGPGPRDWVAWEPGEDD